MGKKREVRVRGPVSRGAETKDRKLILTVMEAWELVAVEMRRWSRLGSRNRGHL